MGLGGWLAGVVLGASLTVTVIPPAFAATASPRPSIGHLAFTGGRDASVVNADGSDRHVVYQPSPAVGGSSLSLASGASSPAWSPDGKRLAFLGPDAAGLPEMFVVGVDGRGLRQVTTLPSEFISGPSWSPDNKHITFSTINAAGEPLGPWDGAAVLWEMNRDGSELKPILTLPGFIQTPAWSPDGKQIAFSHQPTGNVSPSFIEVVSSVGGIPTVVSPMGRSADDPVWSPDSTTLAFNAGGPLYQDTFQKEVWFVRRDGTKPRPLVCSLGCDQNGYESVVWSPDGRWLAIPQYSHKFILVVHPNGTDDRYFRPRPEVDPQSYESDGMLFAPAWSPDSRRIAFIQGPDALSAATSLVAVDLQTRAASLVASAPSAYGYTAQIDWSRR